MNKIKQVLSSQVFWTAIVIVAINVLPQVRQFLSPNAADIISLLLAYFANELHVNAVNNAVSQAQKAPQVQSQN